MAILFSVGASPNSLTINSAAGGGNLVVYNPDLTQTTIFLTTDQLRQLGIVAGSAIATNFALTTIAGTSITSPLKIPPDSYEPPVSGINLTVPLSGTGAGQSYVQYLTQVQTEQLFNSLTLYSVTSR